MACENDESIKRLNKAVFGNGSPENSVLFRLANIEKTTKAIRNIGWVIVCGIIAISIREAASWIHVSRPTEKAVIMAGINDRGTNHDHLSH